MMIIYMIFVFHDTAATEIYTYLHTLSLHDALPIYRYTPHEHFVSGPEGPSTAQFRRIWLFVIAITLHNFPEGLAVGVGFGDGDIGNGTALAIGIGLQNMPEGLAVALALLTLRYSPVQSSEERPVGKSCVRTFRSRWSTYH